MSGANTLSSTIGQLAARLGVAVGALALRLFGGVIDALVPRLGVVVDYHLAFVMRRSSCSCQLREATWRRHRSVGGEVARRAQQT